MHARVHVALFLSRSRSLSRPSVHLSLVFESCSHYRGVIMASDRECEASDAWIEANSVHLLHRGRHQPFYSVSYAGRPHVPVPLTLVLGYTSFSKASIRGLSSSLSPHQQPLSVPRDSLARSLLNWSCP